MNRLWLQCLLVFLLAVVADIVAALHVKALVTDRFTLSVATIVLGHYLAFFWHSWFVDYKEVSKRLAITSATAFGAGVGTAIVMKFLF